LETYAALKLAAEALSPEEWIVLVGRSLSEPTSLSGVPLPSGPSSEFQSAYVGSSGVAAMREAGLFYRFVLDANRRFRDGEINRLLDFGCGWGRYTRLFIREVPEEGLYGVDPQPVAIQVCRRHVPYGCFVNSSTRPPLPFRDQFFDLVVAYSVFSHLSEINAANWIYELTRVLKPGGLLVATTHPVWLLDMVERLQKDVSAVETVWHKVLIRSWPDVVDARLRYARGEFVFAECGEYPDREGYGDVLVPKQYIWDVWGRIMEPMEFVSDPSRVSQAAFVLRRRA
jgi:SAM-dependent methyltransferase